MSEETKPLLPDPSAPAYPPQPSNYDHQPSSYGPPPPPQNTSAPPPPAYSGGGTAGYPPASAPGYQQQQPAAPPLYQQQPAAYNNYQPQAPQAHVGPPTVVVNPKVQFTESPMMMRCTVCSQNITTVINYEMGILTWISVGVLFLLGFLLCAWIPLLISGLKDVAHSCPCCQSKLGIYRRIEF